MFAQYFTPGDTIPVFKEAIVFEFTPKSRGKHLALLYIDIPDKSFT